MTLRRATLVLCLALLAGCPSGEGAGDGAAGPAAAPPSSAGAVASSAPRGPRPSLPLVEVPAEAFVMGSGGSREGGQDCERPRHERTAGARVWLDRHEVTNQAYAEFLASPEAKDHSGCHTEEPQGKDHTPAAPTPQERTWGAVVDPFRGSGRANHPVVGVDWFDAYAFAAWMGRRLPTEEEFEHAARGSSGATFPWGEESPLGDPPRANGHFPADGHAMTAPVGSFPKGAAPCGALDLAGNVWEWTSDPFYAYPGAPEGTPEDPTASVIRGGGWNSPTAFLLRGAMRVGKPRAFRSAAVGFRTAADAPEVAK